MLIDKGFQSNDVVSIKLINGDELIARFESETESVLKFKQPLAVTASQSGLGMIPWIFLGEREVYTLKREHYFIVVPAKKDAADQYLRGTTGIALV